MTSALLVRTTCTRSFSQWFSGFKGTNRQFSPRFQKKSAREGAGKDQAPRLWFPRSTALVGSSKGDRRRKLRIRHAPGRAAVFFASFLFGGLKRKEGGVRGAAPAVLIQSKATVLFFRPPEQTARTVGPLVKLVMRHAPDMIAGASTRHASSGAGGREKRLFQSIL
jgi:hypothetical protein